MVSKKYCTCFTLFIISLTVISGCRPLAYIAFGIHQPKPLSAQDVKQHALNLGVASDNIYRIKEDRFKDVYNERHNLPDLRIYDAQGNLSDFWFTDEKDGCRVRIEEMIARIGADSSRHYLQDSSYMQLKLNLVKLDGSDFSTEVLPDHDYCMVIYSGKFLGTFNKYVEKWILAAKNNHFAKILVIYVNIDLYPEEHVAKKQSAK